MVCAYFICGNLHPFRELEREEATGSSNKKDEEDEEDEEDQEVKSKKVKTVETNEKYVLSMIKVRYLELCCG